METVVRNIRELGNTQRSAAEDLVGHALREDQQLVIQVVTLDTHTSDSTSNELPLDDSQLPHWCNVYEGLTEDEIAELEKAILRPIDLTRPTT